MIRIALAKGRVAKQAIKLFAEFGIHFSDFENNRKLIISDDKGLVEIVLVKPSDTHIYVETGVCDCGIVGKDILLEDNPDVYRLLALNIGICKMCICGYEGYDIRKSNKITAASKFINIGKEYFIRENINANFIKINGSVELAPILNMSDVIVDIVETGSTLKENGLCVLEEICDIFSCFIVNKAAFKMKYDEIYPFMEKLKIANEGVGK